MNYSYDFFRNSYFPKYYRTPDQTYVRMFHASPDTPPIDIYVNNRLVAPYLPYREFTQYIPLQNGIYNIKLFPAGTTRNPLINTNVNIPANTILTIAVINKLKDIALYTIEDTPMNIPQGKVKLRFVHLSPNTSKLDVKLSDRTILFKDIEYKDVTEYLNINPGNYIIEIYGSESERRILYVPNIRLKPNRFYTIYAVGLLGERPPLQVLIPLDGNSYLKVQR